MFAREELGKAQILLGLWREVEEQQRSVTLEEVKKACDDHVHKQTKGQLSIVQRASGNEGFAELLRASLTEDPQAPASREARRELDQITERQWARIPTLRHDA
jgi:hypothetical protein